MILPNRNKSKWLRFDKSFVLCIANHASNALMHRYPSAAPLNTPVNQALFSRLVRVTYLMTLRHRSTSHWAIEQLTCLLQACETKASESITNAVHNMPMLSFSDAVMPPTDPERKFTNEFSLAWATLPSGRCCKQMHFQLSLVQRQYFDPLNRIDSVIPFFLPGYSRMHPTTHKHIPICIFTVSKPNQKRLKVISVLTQENSQAHWIQFHCCVSNGTKISKGDFKLQKQTKCNKNKNVHEIYPHRSTFTLKQPNATDLNCRPTDKFNSVQNWYRRQNHRRAQLGLVVKE